MNRIRDPQLGLREGVFISGESDGMDIVHVNSVWTSSESENEV